MIRLVTWLGVAALALVTVFRAPAGLPVFIAGGLLLLLRREYTRPLARTVDLLERQGSARSFEQHARGQRDPFARLSRAIGATLGRLETTAATLHHREQAFANLYQFAPSALLGLDRTGRVVEANRRAAELLGTDAAALIGASIMDSVVVEDRPRLRQAIGRLDAEPRCRCELRLCTPAGVMDAQVECAGARDEDGSLCSVRLSLVDVTPIKDLQRRLDENSRLLHLVINHMSDAILLVDERGRIAAFNDRLTTLMPGRAGEWRGAAYDAEAFWTPLGLTDRGTFLTGMKLVEFDRRGAAQLRADTRAGTLLFQGVPVDDDAGKPVGRLWVVRDINAQEQSHRLIEQQSHQLRAVRQISRELTAARCLDDLLTQMADRLFARLGVEMLGLAVRDADRAERSIQVIHRGRADYCLDSHRELIKTVRRHLMPRVMRQEDVTFWPDLPANLPWQQPFAHVGATCLAAAPLNSGADSHGIIWIARRGGERLEHHHLHLLEAVAPILAARIEAVCLLQRLHDLHGGDPVTHLPGQERFIERARMFEHQDPAAPWGLVMLSLDRAARTACPSGDDDQRHRRVAAILQRHCRRNNFIARLDAERFAILCPGVSAGELHLLAQRLAHALAQPPRTTADAPLTASVGAAHAPGDGTSAAHLLHLAAARLESAHALGGNSVVDGQSLPARKAG